MVDESICGTSRRRLRQLLVLAGIASTIGILVPAGLGWDFANFYDTGRRALAGQIADIYSPTSLIGGRPPQGSMAFWGAPLSAFFYAPIGLLPPWAALLAFKLAGTLAVAAGLVVLFRQTARLAGLSIEARSRYAVAFLALALLYQPFWTMYRVGGQTTPFVFLSLTLALRDYLEDKLLATAAWMLLVVMFKPAFVLIPAFLALVSPVRFSVGFAVMGAAAAVSSIALFGWPIHQEFLQVLKAGAGKLSPWPFNSSLSILADAFRPIVDSLPVSGPGGGVADGIGIGLKLLVLLLGLVLVRIGGRAHWVVSQHRLYGFAMALSFGLLLSQVVWEHYLAVLFIPLAMLVVAWQELATAARLHLGIILGLCVLQNLVLVLYFRTHVVIHTPAGLLFVSLVKAGPLLAYMLFLWTRRKTILELVGRAQQVGAEAWRR